jgi:hypothetical protein
VHVILVHRSSTRPSLAFDGFSLCLVLRSF